MENQVSNRFGRFHHQDQDFLNNQSPLFPPASLRRSILPSVEPVELGGLTLLKLKLLALKFKMDICRVPLGCGHGLPGIFACLEGAAAIHFQDFNMEVLQCLTIPNVNSNVPSFQRPALQVTKCDEGTEIHFFAGDWCEIHKLLPYAQNIEKDLNRVYSIFALPHLYELIKKNCELAAAVDKKDVEIVTSSSGLMGNYSADLSKL
ncbi:Putative methyltransferase family protein [Prunus dulcis]|uniref:Methyltransferase family protein n=1 Tax=Prunus dulcis TaxID=3755 RepID=A0A5H2XKJ8_PRUDU|nr:Putative methyltransferase family protein [Prunus dulcis]